MRKWSVAVGAGVAVSLIAQSPDLHARLDANAPTWLKKFDVPSVAVAWIENGKLSWTAVYGEQSPGVPATKKTLYNIASLTKPVTAETILRLAARGAIQLDEPLSPSWVDPDVAANPWNKLLTPRLCLSHQTGFPNWRYQTKNVLEFEWKPGTQTGYSGEGYDYVARFAEKKLGRPFESLAKELVLDPIGMKETSFTARAWQVGRIASSAGSSKDLSEKWSAADLLHSTIDDYARFVVSVMHDQKITKTIAFERLTPVRNIAKPEDIAHLCALAEASSCAVSAGMGLGWEILNFNGETIVRHTGSDPGVRTVALFVPSKKIGLVVFTSGEEGNKVIREVVSLLYPNRLLIQIF